MEQYVDYLDDGCYIGLEFDVVDNVPISQSNPT